MEYTWQYIFTGQSEFYLLQHQCHCDGYGICFGERTDAALQNWLGLLKKRERADAELDCLPRSSPEDLRSLTTARAERDTLNAELDRLRLGSLQTR